jgi:hypothetical protein
VEGWFAQAKFPIRKFDEIKLIRLESYFLFQPEPTKHLLFSEDILKNSEALGHEEKYPEKGQN